MIPRGATRTATLRLKDSVPWQWDELADFRVDFENDKRVISKPASACTFDGRDLFVPFTECETLAFDDEDILEVQVCVRFQDGNIDKSRIKSDKVGRILNEAPMPRLNNG